MSAYRDDLAALEARRAALDAEIADRTRERDEAAQMLAEARRTADAQAWLDGAAERDRRFRNRVGIGVTALMTIIVAIGVGLYATRGPDPVEKAMHQYESWSDTVCACKDKACSDAVMQDLTKWSTELARQWENPPRLSGDQMAHASEIGKRMTDCLARLNAAQ